MRDKEKLLSFESPTSFIFTHSALAEGWDNPNVFNICTLRITSSVVTKRQTIGRGLRIPVDQAGKRFENPFENKLTVIANESYMDFSRNLQQDYENEGILAAPPIENRRNKVVAKLQPDLFKGEFTEIWNHLKIKTIFESEINTDNLIKNCLQQINQELFVTKPLLMTRKAKLDFSKTGIDYNEVESDKAKEVELEYAIPDVVTRIANETKLTKKTVAEILLESEKLNEIFNNPEEFIFKVAKLIKDQKMRMEVVTAKYSKISEKYNDSIFPLEIEVYQSNVVDSNRAVYNKVICDTPSEKEFAKKLSDDEQVNLFSKLPQEYYISTPVGDYRPDWAIIYQRRRIDGKIEGKLYLVRETKFGYTPIAGTLESISDLEQAKINCAFKHFKELGVIHFKVVQSYEEFKQTLPN